MPPTSDFTLKHVVLDPQPQPSTVEIIFVTGYDPALRPICERFSEDFDFQYLCVFDYLTSLLDRDIDDDERQQALGALHPAALADMLKPGPDSQVPAFFLIPILLNKIDSYVRDGYRRFLIAGLGEDIETWMQFAEKISVPSAIFSFGWDHVVTARRVSIEEFYEPITIDIRRVYGDDDAAYFNLLGAIAERAWKK